MQLHIKRNDTQAAKSLCTRFRPNAGVIQSWDVKAIAGKVKEAGNVRLSLTT